MAIFKTIAGHLLDWVGVVNVPAALTALEKLKGKTGQIIEIGGVDAQGGVTELVAVEKPEGGGGSGQNANGLTAAKINALDGMFKVCAYDDSKDVSGAYAAFRAAFGLDSSGEKTLTSISAVYSGGSVPVGTAVSALTGIVVTAHYSDGSTATVTGYTLSGSIAEGENTVTVSYGGMTATIAVVGVAQDDNGSNNPTIVKNYRYSFENTIKADDGYDDLALEATTPTYIDGIDGVAYDVASAGSVAIAANVDTDVLSADFTIAFDFYPKGSCYPFMSQEYKTSTGMSTYTVVASGDIALSGVGFNTKYAGVAIFVENYMKIRFCNQTLTGGVSVNITGLNNDLLRDAWHNVVLRRANGVISAYVDKKLLFTAEVADPLMLSSQVAIGSGFYEDGTNTGNTYKIGSGCRIDNLVIASAALSDTEIWGVE